MTVRVLQGDAIAKLRELPADSVHCVVTSPPYFGLRDYGTGTWEGGEAGCDHRKVTRPDAGEAKSGLEGGKKTNGHQQEGFGGLCGRCGARRIDQQIGLEESPEAWAARLVEVFREVRRVLRPDGCCFVNVGDSYCAHPNQRSVEDKAGAKQRTNVGSTGTPSRHVDGLKPKDLIGQPWLLAFALRADGWWLRSEIIWAKPNPMPESVKGSHFVRHQFDEEGSDDPSLLVDCPGCQQCSPYGGYIFRMSAGRPTKAHETVFLLTKSARYFYDAEAVREAHQGRAPESYGDIKAREMRDVPNGVRKAVDTLGLREYNPAGRNLRSVWQIATEPFPEAHFATFPTELARRCILAGTSAKGCCPACGAPWARVVESALYSSTYGYSRREDVPNSNDQKGNGQQFGTRGFAERMRKETATIGWRPSCSCDAGEPVPCTVLDPFGGSGTTGLVADQLGRDAVLIELSPEYADMAATRIGRARARRLIGDAPRVDPLPGQLGLF